MKFTDSTLWDQNYEIATKPNIILVIFDNFEKQIEFFAKLICKFLNHGKETS